MIDYIAEIAKIKLPFEPVATPWGKRLFDIVCSIAFGLALSPFILFVIAVNGIEQLLAPSSRGPLLYSEIRISKGLPFKMYKFRIFKLSASKLYFERHGFIQTKALEQDPQNLTQTGKLLKKIYMDELPQLYNVLKGDMTMVGPRPSNVIVTWQDGKNGFFQRYLFACGITGPFQLHKDSTIPLNQNKVDMEYILFCKNNPIRKIIWFDIKILLGTVFTVLRARGI